MTVLSPSTTPSKRSMEVSHTNKGSFTSNSSDSTVTGGDELVEEEELGVMVGRFLLPALPSKDRQQQFPSKSPQLQDIESIDFTWIETKFSAIYSLLCWFAGLMHTLVVGYILHSLFTCNLVQGTWIEQCWLQSNSSESKETWPPPALLVFSLLTVVTLVVHPDGYTWIVLGKVRTFMGWLLRTASRCWDILIHEYGVLPTVAASVTLGALFFLGYVLYKTLSPKENLALSNSKQSSSHDKKKKKRKGHGRGGNQRGGGGNNNNGRIKSNNYSKRTTGTSETPTSPSVAVSSSLGSGTMPLAEEDETSMILPSTSTSKVNKRSTEQHRSRISTETTVDTLQSTLTDDQSYESSSTGGGVTAFANQPKSSSSNGGSSSTAVQLGDSTIEDTALSSNSSKLGSKNKKNHRSTNNTKSNSHASPSNATTPTRKGANNRRNNKNKKNEKTSAELSTSATSLPHATTSSRWDSLKPNGSNASRTNLSTSGNKPDGSSKSSNNRRKKGRVSPVPPGRSANSPARSRVLSGDSAAASLDINAPLFSQTPPRPMATRNSNFVPPPPGLSPVSNSTVAPPPGLGGMDYNPSSNVGFGSLTLDNVVTSPPRGFGGSSAVRTTASDWDDQASNATPTSFLRAPSLSADWSTGGDSTHLMAPAPSPARSFVANGRVKENPFAESSESQIEAELQELGGQMAGSILDF